MNDPVAIRLPTNAARRFIAKGVTLVAFRMLCLYGIYEFLALLIATAAARFVRVEGTIHGRVG